MGTGTVGTEGAGVDPAAKEDTVARTKYKDGALPHQPDPTIATDIPNYGRHTVIAKRGCARRYVVLGEVPTFSGGERRVLLAEATTGQRLAEGWTPKALWVFGYEEVGTLPDDAVARLLHAGGGPLVDVRTRGASRVNPDLPRNAKRCNKGQPIPLTKDDVAVEGANPLSGAKTVPRFEGPAGRQTVVGLKVRCSLCGKAVPVVFYPKLGAYRLRKHRPGKGSKQEE